MINRDAWLAAIREAEESEETENDALTVREYAELAQCGRDVARRRLEHMCEAGKAARVTKRKRDEQGRPHVVPAYRLIVEKDRNMTDACDDADTLDGADVKDRSPQPDDNSEPTLHRRVRKVPRPAVRGVPQVPQREPGHRGQYLASRERPRGDR